LVENPIHAGQFHRQKVLIGEAAANQAKSDFFIGFGPITIV
jgi:hypothetical protein